MFAKCKGKWFVVSEDHKRSALQVVSEMSYSQNQGQKKVVCSNHVGVTKYIVLLADYT